MNQMPSRRSIKLKSKQLIAHWRSQCFRVTLIFILAMAVVTLFQQNFGGTLNCFVMEAGEYHNATGVYLSNGGMTAILRMDKAGLILVLPVSLNQLGSFLLVHAVALLLLSPLRLGLYRQYNALLNQAPLPQNSIFDLYKNIRLTGEAARLMLVLQCSRWGLCLLSVLPGGALLAIINSARMSEINPTVFSVLSAAAVVMMITGALLAYGVYLILEPAQYMMAFHPEYTVGECLRRGTALLKGRRREYFELRFSFCLWYLLGGMAFGMSNLFGLPYAEFSVIMYLRLVQDGTAPAPAASSPGRYSTLEHLDPMGDREEPWDR